jgi:hypothetical protein
VKNAGARVDHQGNAGRGGRGIERSDLLRRAVFKQLKIVLSQAAHLRSVRRRDRARHLHQRDARTDRALGRDGRGIVRGCAQFAGRRITRKSNVASQRNRTLQLWRFCRGSFLRRRATGSRIGCVQQDQNCKRKNGGASKDSEHALSMPDVFLVRISQ